MILNISVHMTDNMCVVILFVWMNGNDQTKLTIPDNLSKFMTDIQTISIFFIVYTSNSVFIAIGSY